MAAGIILASQSRSRRSILENAGIPHRVVPADVDEAAIKAGMRGMPAAEIALELAREKALAVSALHPSALVIGGDQVLDCEGRLYDKPVSLAEAKQHLISLRGKQHRLESALACAENGKILWDCVAQASLAMRDFSDAFIDSYVKDRGDSLLSSVGGYQVESRGVQLFAEIRGDHFVILGLPLLELCAFLRREGLLPS
jgi:septum formation protein